MVTCDLNGSLLPLRLSTTIFWLTAGAEGSYSGWRWYDGVSDHHVPNKNVKLYVELVCCLRDGPESVILYSFILYKQDCDNLLYRSPTLNTLL